jgi:hypothetical protein
MAAMTAPTICPPAAGHPRVYTKYECPKCGQAIKWCGEPDHGKPLFMEYVRREDYEKADAEGWRRGYDQGWDERAKFDERKL